MKNTYITFGRSHTHKVGNQIFDKDSVCLIRHEDDESGRTIAENIFGLRFCTTYHSIAAIHIDCYPRGVIPLEPKADEDGVLRCDFALKPELVNISERKADEGFVGRIVQGQAEFISVTGVSPSYIYLGRKEVDELNFFDKYSQYINYIPVDQTHKNCERHIRGMQIIEVDLDSHMRYS